MNTSRVVFWENSWPYPQVLLLHSSCRGKITAEFYMFILKHLFLHVLNIYWTPKKKCTIPGNRDVTVNTTRPGEVYVCIVSTWQVLTVSLVSRTPYLDMAFEHLKVSKIKIPLFSSSSSPNKAFETMLTFTFKLRIIPYCYLRHKPCPLSLIPHI